MPNLRPPLPTPESGTAVLGLLFPDPALGTGKQTELAAEVSRGLEDAAGRGSAEVSGAIPAETEGWSLVSDRLPLVEIVMVAVVFLIVAWQFRALGVPLLNLAGVALAYLISVRVIAEVGEQLDLRAPQEVEPLIVALLFGVVTDYLVFFAYGFRRRLAQGLDPRRSAIETTAGLLPVVLTAGLIIAGACATLLLADLSFLRSFGPGWRSPCWSRSRSRSPSSPRPWRSPATGCSGREGPAPWRGPRRSGSREAGSPAWRRDIPWSSECCAWRSSPQRRPGCARCRWATR